MAEPEFNLLEEPWIRVMTKDHKIKELSLTDTLIYSHEYVGLAGELEAQNVAVLRLCLAALHTIFHRYNVNGEREELNNKEMAYERWEDLWKEGYFPEAIIRQYFEQHKDRFWLFHPEKPFYQANEAKKGTEYTAAKLNGEVSESSNKVRMFAVRGGESKSQLTYAEAARWLLFINGFDDASAKTKVKGLPSLTVGWIGRLGIVEAIGHNLFETLMLNLVFERMGDKWTDNRPVWEREPKGDERTEIPLPNNPAELLTLQSRRILLIRKKRMVVGYYLLGGDFFSKVNAFAETMTAWSPIPNKGSGESEFQPKCHDPKKQMWREFGNLFLEAKEETQKPEKRLPGVVSWISELRTEGCLGKFGKAGKIMFRSVSVQYKGSQNSAIEDTFSDSLVFHSDILVRQKWMIWGKRIENEVKKCEELARLIEELSRKLNLSAGFKRSGEEAKAEFYRQIDLPFRSWLEALDPQEEQERPIDYEERKCEEWHKMALTIAKRVADGLMDNLGPAAFVGRRVEEKDKSYWCCAPKAYNIFLYWVARVYQDKNDSQTEQTSNSK
ncbi:type I-E CRISPR-associated protein Cse1/CasA [Firmicutes bacterium AF25-13AC]|nr:type I-E CRISPR-associated protein Cse1/CasA [Firmicutes bacterium AF25-13AC]